MKVKQSQIAWEGSSWRLRVDTLAAPDSTELERGFIEHPGAIVGLLKAADYLAKQP